MSLIKTKIRFFTIADYLEEEQWLRAEHKNGWKLIKMIPPCFYKFEKCQPEDVIYKLDFKNNQEKADYLQLTSDFGWEYIGKCTGWLYFRKPASSINFENEGEIFSDNQSKINMVYNIIKTRMLPIILIFFICVLPNFIINISEENTLSTRFWAVMNAVYIVLITYTAVKFNKIKQKLK